MKDLDGRVAVITGASRGIGAGLARVFHRCGLKLGLCARGEPGAGEVPEDKERIHFERISMTADAAVETFAARVEERLGPVELWVNNAGVLEPIGPVAEVDPAAWGHHVDVNLKGVYHGMHTFLKHCHRSGRGGTLVNITSGAASSPYEGWGAYCAGKAAVDMLTRVAAMEERRRGIRVFALAPGVIATRMQEVIRRQEERDFPMVGKFRELDSAGQLLDPESPAPAVLRLAFGPPLPEGTDPVLDVRGSPELEDLGAFRTVGNP